MKWIYILLVNIWAFYLMGNDKQKAKRKEWRISESMLFFAAAIGGAFGAWLGMYTFRHKTQKMQFVVGIPLLALLTAAALWTMR
ncbi:DUF1294 domain-containing protein [Ectobacillus panaciterrae]|uniref:DUF1294 domain-containing protein n=1 Tax=Ectobacillus panaciterrae TaxID=363872 RepID=UPI00040D6AE6|nr:DUF1294 domain-containing protein [Ectobacillus panaciterrae]